MSLLAAVKRAKLDINKAPKCRPIYVGVSCAPGVLPQLAQPETVPPKRSPSHYLWAVLIARIYEAFLLLCRLCGGQMRLIAFITNGAEVRKFLEHIGVDCEPPHLNPARGHRCGRNVMRRRTTRCQASGTGK